MYWAAWTVTFVVHPENASDPDLESFYDEGSPYGFIGDVDGSGLSYAKQQEAYEAAIAEMLSIAGTSERGSQLESFLWALRGGRMDDIEGIIRAVTTSTHHDVESVMNWTSLAREQGVDAFAEQFNRSVRPEAVLSDQIGQRLPLPSGSHVVSILLPISLLVLLIGLGWRRTRLLSVAGLVVVLSYAAAIGSIRADNYRFLITTSAFGIAVATGVITSLATVWSLSRRNGPRRKLEP